jgi:hypothetical protein
MQMNGRISLKRLVILRKLLAKSLIGEHFPQTKFWNFVYGLLIEDRPLHEQACASLET